MRDSGGRVWTAGQVVDDGRFNAAGVRLRRLEYSWKHVFRSILASGQTWGVGLRHRAPIETIGISCWKGHAE